MPRTALKVANPERLQAGFLRSCPDAVGPDPLAHIIAGSEIKTAIAGLHDILTVHQIEGYNYTRAFGFRPGT